jgi:hypothetical protein
MLTSALQGNLTFGSPWQVQKGGLERHKVHVTCIAAFESLSLRVVVEGLELKLMDEER